MTIRSIDSSGLDEPKDHPKVYISGPMTGMPDHNFAAFNAAAARLRAAGIDVINPAEINVPGTATWADFMRADIKQLCDCCGIYMLNGWDKSKGAWVEMFIAKELGMSIQFEAVEEVAQ
jgi:hypothetical protein